MIYGIFLYGYVNMIEKSCILELFVVLYMMFVFEYLFVLKKRIKSVKGKFDIFRYYFLFVFSFRVIRLFSFRLICEIVSFY